MNPIISPFQNHNCSLSISAICITFKKIKLYTITKYQQEFVIIDLISTKITLFQALSLYKFWKIICQKKVEENHKRNKRKLKSVFLISYFFTNCRLRNLDPESRYTAEITCIQRLCVWLSIFYRMETWQTLNPGGPLFYSLLNQQLLSWCKHPE